MTVQLKPHQQKAVDKLSNGKILYGGTGVGKSITAMAYFFTKVCKGVPGDWGSMRTPRDVYVITTAKKRDSLDWEKEAAKFGIGREHDASVESIILTVDSWNNIDKYSGVKDAFFIFDEQRLVGSGAWTKAFIKIAKANEWILLSATPGDTWLDYIPVFVANGWYKNRTEFKRRHVVYNTFSKFPKVDRYIETGTLVRYRNQLLVHMPYERHTVRHPVEIEVSYDESTFEKVSVKRWHVYESRPLRDVAELFSVMRKVVNSDTSRLRSVEALLSKHPKLIVFYNFDYELEILRTLVPEDQLASPESLRDLKQKLDSSPKSRTDGSLSSQTSTASSSFSSSGPGKRTESDTGSTTSNSSLERNEGCLTTRTDRSATSEGCERPVHSPTDVTTSDANPSISASPPFECDPTCSGCITDRSTGLRSSEPGKSGGKTSHSSSNSKCCEGKGPSTAKDRCQRCDTSSTISTGETSFAVAEWNGHKHEPIPETDRWVYLVQYQAGAEGWNCVSTDAMCFYSLTYSYKILHQAHGRIDRLNTPFTHLYYYTLVSKSLIDKAILKSLKAKKSFNEKNLVI